MTDALDRMETRIEDLLNRARGQQDVDRQTVSLEQLATAAWPGLDTKEATLAVAEDERFDADATRLKQLFENLYRNAVEHAGSDATVTVGTHDNGFYVADDGPGIPPDRREAVFEQGGTDNEDGRLRSRHRLGDRRWPRLGNRGDRERTRWCPIRGPVRSLAVRTVTRPATAPVSGAVNGPSSAAVTVSPRREQSWLRRR